MTAYTRKPIQAIARCPVCSWLKIYFETQHPGRDVKITAALRTAEHILSKHKEKPKP